jgi:hypothetical protein
MSEKKEFDWDKFREEQKQRNEKAKKDRADKNGDIRRDIKRGKK